MLKYFTYFFFILLLLSIPTSAAQPLYIEYFHQTGCHDCEITDPIIDQIEKQYESIEIVRIDVINTEGFNRWNQYGFIEVPAVVINNETKIPKEELTEEKLRLSIDRYFKDNKPENQYINSDLNLPFAYSLGLFAGFSPCLMAILGFLLSFTAGTSESTRSGMERAIVFGVGLMTSYLAIGVGLLVFRKTLPDMELFSVVTGIIVIGIGLYLMGLFSLPMSLDKYFQNKARKHAGTIGGLFFLGVLFSLVKVPCTVPMLLVLLNKTITEGTIGDLALLFAFSFGVLTPFLGIGLLGGYTLSKHVREHRRYLKLISGISLVLLGLWVMI
ncbi:cytochrome c biogenesis protein CcdA [Methanococcoides seepicolus]|uniref:Cytochrome c biogenesis protein n=1 Tax=Methanococcoides seepicolus TaxID=2828780 RepID=A0A9E5DB30_9EURY|nr:cytochrome c biogenesis protein CcdA [Methanococcoides seepicolus]MCM1985978.1 cytochrome c biogenesis protein [Methanococcoides seepicolus]